VAGTDTRPQQYRRLLRSEQQLQERLHLLEREYARNGPLFAPAQLELALMEERETLNRLRGEISQLEHELEREQRSYAAAEAKKARAEELRIRRQRIKLLEADIAHKREQARIYEENIRYLETMQAQSGMVAPLDLINQINETRTLLTSVRGEIETQTEALQELSGQSGATLSNTQAPPWHLAPGLTSELQQYRDLQHREKQLIDLVYLLSRKYSLYGSTPLIHVVRDLAEEREKLERLRKEIDQLEQELTREQHEYDAAKAAQYQMAMLSIWRQRIEDLAIDLKRKHELARIYNENIRYLETIQAQLGSGTPVNIKNEITKMSGLRADVYREIQFQGKILEDKYAISPERLEKLSQLSDQEIAILVKELICQISPNQ
jgi:hypothetical protein